MTNTQTVDSTDDQTSIDGRRARSERSKRKIATAMLDLIMEGDLSPSAENVAARANVGLRSVFRHFKDMESLLAEVSEIIHSEYMPHLIGNQSNAEFPQSLADLIEKRTAAYEKLMPVRMSTSLQRHRSKFIEQQLEKDNKNLQQGLIDVLPQDLSKDSTVLHSLVLSLSIETWIRLRRDQGLSAAQAGKVVEHMTSALIEISKP